MNDGGSSSGWTTLHSTAVLLKTCLFPLKTKKIGYFQFKFIWNKKKSKIPLFDFIALL